MKALVTGVGGGIGGECAKILKANGYEILTLKSRFENLNELEKEVGELSQKHEISALLLCAGVGKFDPLECQKAGEIANLINTILPADSPRAGT